MLEANSRGKQISFLSAKRYYFFTVVKGTEHFKLHTVLSMRKEARFSSVVHLSDIIHLSNW